METRIYPVYESFVHKINTREIYNFYLTPHLPKGVGVRHWEPKENLPLTELEQIVQEKTLIERPVICVGIREGIGYIYAIRKDFKLK